ncbi:MAG: M23 family metallopeptidase [Bacilli bacterium]
MTKAAIIFLQQLLKDVKEGGKKLRVIILALVIPFVLIFCIFDYFTSWFTGLFSSDVEMCLENELIRNTVYAFVSEIDDLELENSEQFVKDYFILKGTCKVPDEDTYNKIQKKYNLTDEQIKNIKDFIEENKTHSTYQNVGDAGYVSSVNTVTSCFGPRWGTEHKGIDISGAGNPPIYAYDEGFVIESSYNIDFGYYVVISHSDELKTRYFHMYEYGIAVGSHVKKGEQIGIMGTTGDSTGVHLHFEIMINGIQIDPYPYLITTGIQC